MLKRIPYKKKNQLLLVVSLIFMVICYYLAIENTLNLRAQCSEIKEELSIAAKAPIKIAELEQQLKSIEGVIGNQAREGIDPQQQLLQFVSHYCEEQQIILRDFPQPNSVEEDDYAIETNIFAVRGDFLKLLKMTYALEQDMRIGKVVAVTYRAKKNLRAKRLELIATIYLQNVRKLDT